MTETKIRLTRTPGYDAGTFEYRYENDTFRFIVNATPGDFFKYEIHVFTLKTVGTIPPVLIITDQHIETMGCDTLADARMDIADYIDRRAAGRSY